MKRVNEQVFCRTCYKWYDIEGNTIYRIAFCPTCHSRFNFNSKSDYKKSTKRILSERVAMILYYILYFGIITLWGFGYLLLVATKITEDSKNKWVALVGISIGLPLYLFDKYGDEIYENLQKKIFKRLIYTKITKFKIQLPLNIFKTLTFLEWVGLISGLITICGFVIPQIFLLAKKIFEILSSK